MSIRKVSLMDVADILKVEQESFLRPWPYSLFMMFALAGGSIIDGEKIIRMVVYEHEGHIIGYAVWEYDSETQAGHLLNIAIDEHHRRQGNGTELLDYVENSLRRNGAKRYFLEVRESNHSARSFYEKNGFRPVDRSVRYYVDEDAIIYEMAL